MTVQAAAVRRLLEPDQEQGARGAARSSSRPVARRSPRCGAWSACCAAPKRRLRSRRSRASSTSSKLVAHDARGRAARRAADRGHADRSCPPASTRPPTDRPGGSDQRGQARERSPGGGRSSATGTAPSSWSSATTAAGTATAAEAGTGSSECASACRSTGASSRRDRRPAADSGSVRHSPSREPGRERNHHTHLPLHRHRRLDRAPAQAAGRLQRRLRGSPAPAAGTAWEAHGGRELDTQGDSFFVAFRRRRHAVDAAVAAQRALADHSWPEERGSARADRRAHRRGDGRRRPLRRAGRPSRRPHLRRRPRRPDPRSRRRPGRCSRTRSERDLDLHDLGPHQLKDFDRPVRIYQLAIEGLPATSRRCARSTGETAPHLADRQEEHAAPTVGSRRPRPDRRRPGARPRPASG